MKTFRHALVLNTKDIMLKKEDGIHLYFQIFQIKKT